MKINKQLNGTIEINMRDKTIIFTPHAKQRLIEKNIDKIILKQFIMILTKEKFDLNDTIIIEIGEYNFVVHKIFNYKRKRIEIEVISITNNAYAFNYNKKLILGGVK